MDKKGVGGSSSSGVSNSSKISDYEIQGKLGQGSFGIVYKVKRKRKFASNKLFITLTNW